MNSEKTIFSIGCLVAILNLALHFTVWGLVIFILYKIAIWLCN